MFLSFRWLVLPFRERNNFIAEELKTHNYMLLTDFQHKKIIPFSKSQPRVYA